MGHLVVASCTCGYESNMISVGYGFSALYYAPCICLECQKITSRVFYKKNGITRRKQSCGKCKGSMQYLDAPSILNPNKNVPIMEEDKFPWDYLEDNITYKCPQCKNYNLSLDTCGFWD